MTGQSTQYNRPMKVVISGEDERKRAEREAAVVRELQGQGRRTEHIDAAKTDVEEIMISLGTQAMFEQPKVLVVRGLEKLRSPKAQAAIITALGSTNDDVVLSIAKDLTPGLKKQFDPKVWKNETFPLPKSVFAFCDALKTKPYAEAHRLLRQVLADGGEWWLNAQLARTLHALLLVKAGSSPAGAPFQIQKWKKQASAFTQEELSSALDGLYQIESSIKLGKTKLTWGQQFDILLAKLYDGLH